MVPQRTNSGASHRFDLILNSNLQTNTHKHTMEIEIVVQFDQWPKVGLQIHKFRICFCAQIHLQLDLELTYNIVLYMMMMIVFCCECLQWSICGRANRNSDTKIEWAS